MTGRDGTPAVYFLSDYGLADEFVGVVRAVLHTLAPGVTVIDLGHEVAPFDVGAGAAMLTRCASYLGEGVVLAVVDPGVGTNRRGIAVETVGGGPSWLVGPDNGLLVPLARALGGARRAVVLAPAQAPAGTGPATSRSTDRAGRTDRADRAGRTFDGRDLFAPAAAHLVLGRPAAELGAEADPGSLESWGSAGPPGTVRDPAPGATGAPGDPGAGETGGADGELEVLVTWIDRFGNVQLGVGPDALGRIGAPDSALLWATLRGPVSDETTPPRAPWRRLPVRRVEAFEDLDAGELGLITDSTGRLALVLCRASAARRLQPLETGDTVRISASPVPPAPAAAGGPSPGDRP